MSPANSESVLESIFASCDVKGGRGNPKALIAVIFDAPAPDRFFEDANYLSRLCDHFGIPVSDLYVTPIIKDYKHLKPIPEYIDLLIEELAVVNPNLGWILGRAPLELMGLGDPKQYYGHLFGMYMPLLVEGFYGLLLPNSQQVANMPAEVQTELNDRFQKVVQHYFKLKAQNPTGPQEVPQRLRGDLLAIRALADYERFEYDPKLRHERSYFFLWSPKIRDHVIVCMTEEAKKKWLRLGFGIVFTAKEVAELERNQADFLAQSIKFFKARTAEIVLTEG